MVKVPKQYSELERTNLLSYDAGSQLRDHINRRSHKFFTVGDAARDAVTTSELVRTRQEQLRSFFMQCLGGLPQTDCPLNMRETGQVELTDITIRKIIFDSRPLTPVTANLYLPRRFDPSGGAILFLCGHEREAKHCEEYQKVCQILALSGFIVLAMDPIGQGERLSYYEPRVQRETVGWGIREHDYAGAQALLIGDNIARYFLHDAMRAVDLLCSLPEVDSQKIGVTGNSGGGTQTAMMMMADPRIAAAAPATFIMSRASYLRTGEAQDAEQIWPGFTAAGYDHEDILLAMAPRPVCVLGATWDSFPIDGTRRTVERARRFWEIFGVAGSFQYFEDQAPHQYTEAMARVAADFFRRHFGGKSVSAKVLRIPQSVSPKELWCTQSGQVREEFPAFRTVYDENCSRLGKIENARAADGDALERLREIVLRGRKPCPFAARLCAREAMQELDVEIWHWNVQEDLKNSGYLLRHYRFSGQSLPVTIAVWEGGTRNLRNHAEWLQRCCEQGRSVLVLNTVGVGQLAPLDTCPNEKDCYEFYGTLHVLNDNLLWLGDSLAAMRTYDVLRAVKLLNELPGISSEDIRLFIDGREAWPARIAAKLEPRIVKVEDTAPEFTYRTVVQSRHYQCRDIKSSVLPGILRYCDL